MSLGCALNELGDHEQAAAEWHAAVQINPKEPFARAALAIGVFRLGQLEDAKMQYGEALALDRRYADVDSLRLDIRWKPRALGILERLKDLAQ
jgi:Flp pilus assembly protein TadD